MPAQLRPFSHQKKFIGTKISTFRQSFNKFNLEGFDFTNGFKCSDVPKFEKLNNLSFNIFEKVSIKIKILFENIN